MLVDIPYALVYLVQLIKNKINKSVTNYLGETARVVDISVK